MPGFDLKADVNRVEMSVAGHDEDFVMEGFVQTDDPALIRALDANPSVKRASKPEKKEVKNPNDEKVTE